jgi:thiol-disulfide isomerase/thioredoxin
MRSLILTLFCLSSVFGYSQTGNYFSKEFISIGGKIEQYQPDTKNGFISFRSNDLKGRSSDTAILIEKDGSFAVRIYQPFAGDIAFIYNEEFVTLYASPGDRIRLTINATQFAQKETRTASIKIEGEKLPISKWILQWHEVKDKWTPTFSADWENKELSDTIFAEQRKKQLAEEESFLENFIAERDPSKEFISWARNSLLYYAGLETSFHCFAGKLNDKLHDTALMELLRDFPLNSEQAIHCSEYYRFLSILSGDLQIIVNLHPSYEERKKLNGKNAFPIYMELYDKYATGLARELLYYNLFVSNSPTISEPYLPVFQQKVQNEIVRNDMTIKRTKLVQPFQPVDIIARIKSHKADTLSKKRILTLLENLKGQNVFIDFWGSWCAPCMTEMKYYPELMDSLKNLPVQFVFLSAETKDEKVEEVKTKFPPSAHFLNLTDNETRLLTNVFRFNSYPSHFMLDGEGKTLDLRLGGIANTNGLNKFAIDRIRQKTK